MGLLGFLQTLLLYFRVFKRRFFAILGLGKSKNENESLLPQQVERREGTTSSGKGGKQSSDDWEHWTLDAKEEVRVSVVPQEQLIAERQIDNLFAEMAPVLPPSRPAAAPRFPAFEPPQHSTMTHSRFAVSDLPTSKVCFW
jgi:hypothetical protein